MNPLIPSYLCKIPPALPFNIVRSSLLENIRQQSFARLILVEAPGGYGKTQILAEFVRSRPNLTAWFPIEQLSNNGNTRSPDQNTTKGTFKDSSFFVNPEALANLRNVLASLYSDEASIRRIMADSRIDPSRIVLNSTAINNWHSVLTEAEKVGRIDALLTVVEREYESNKEFLNAGAIYRQSTRKTGNDQSNDQSSNSDLLEFVYNLINILHSTFHCFEASLLDYVQNIHWIESVNSIESALLKNLPLIISTQLNAFGRPVECVLDNYHLLENPNIDRFLVQLVLQTPGIFRFFIASRRTLLWPERQQLMANGTLAVISQEQLEFTLAEAQNLARQVNPPVQDEEIVSIHQQVGKWPILFVLACRNTRLSVSLDNQWGEQANENLSPNILRSVLYPYLEQLIKNEPLNVQKFLLYTSVLRELTVEDCNLLLDIQDAETILEDMEQSAFLQSVWREQCKSYIHHHELFRQFLCDKLVEYCDAITVQNLYRRLGDLLLNKYEQVNEALNSYIQAVNLDAVESLFEQWGLDLIQNLEYWQLNQWLQRVPSEWLVCSSPLMICQAVILSNQKDTRAQDILHRAHRLACQNKQTKYEIWALTELAMFHYYQEDYVQAAEIFTRIPTTELPILLRVRTLYCKVMIYYGIDRFQDAIIAAKEALAVCQTMVKEDVSSVRAFTTRLLGTIYGRLGLLQKAVQILENEYQLAPTSLFARAWILSNLSAQYRMFAEYEKALTAIAKAKELLEPYRSIIPLHRLYGYLELNEAHVRCDQYDYTFMEQWVASWLNSPLYAITPIPEEAVLDFYFAHENTYPKGFDTAQQLWRREQASTSFVDQAYASGILGVAHVFLDLLPEAEQLLTKAINTLDQHSILNEQLGFQLFLAETYLRTEQQQKAVDLLRTTLQSMVDCGYATVDIWQPEIMAHLFALALEHDIHPEYVEVLAIKRFKPQHLTFFFKLLRNPALSIRQRVQRILRQIVGDDWGTTQRLLESCPEPSTRQRLVDWLASGWLRVYGLLYLHEIFSWRELEVFLLWIHPDIQAETDTIARELILSAETVKGYLKSIRTKFKTHSGIALDGRGAQGKAYNWTIKNNIIDPHRESSHP